MKRILIDIDEIIRAWCVALIDAHRLYFPEETIKILPTYYISEWSSLGTAIYDFAFKMAAKEICLQARPIHGSINALNLLRKKGHYIILASAQPNMESEIYTTKWLAQFDVPFNELHYQKEKWKIPADIFIDDCVDNLIKYQETYPQAIILTLAKPWNSNWKGFRSSSWNNIIDYLEEI